MSSNTEFAEKSRSKSGKFSKGKSNKSSGRVLYDIIDDGVFTNDKMLLDDKLWTTEVHNQRENKRTSAKKNRHIRLGSSSSEEDSSSQDSSSQDEDKHKFSISEGRVKVKKELKTDNTIVDLTKGNDSSEEEEVEAYVEKATNNNVKKLQNAMNKRNLNTLQSAINDAQQHKGVPKKLMSDAINILEKDTFGGSRFNRENMKNDLRATKKQQKKRSEKKKKGIYQKIRQNNNNCNYDYDEIEHFHSHHGYHVTEDVEFEKRQYELATIWCHQEIQREKIRLQMDPHMDNCVISHSNFYVGNSSTTRQFPSSMFRIHNYTDIKKGSYSRIDPSDGNQYTYEEFIEFYGEDMGISEWDNAYVHWGMWKMDTKPKELKFNPAQQLIELYNKEYQMDSEWTYGDPTSIFTFKENKNGNVVPCLYSSNYMYRLSSVPTF